MRVHQLFLSDGERKSVETFLLICGSLALTMRKLVFFLRKKEIPQHIYFIYRSYFRKVLKIFLT